MGDTKSSKMLRVHNEIAPILPQLNELARQGKPVADALQKMIDRLFQPDQDEPASDPAPVDSFIAAPDPGLLEIMQRLEQKIDRLSQQPHQAAPAEILTTNQLIERSGIPFGQIAAAARTTGQPLETVLAQRTGCRHLGNGTFAK